MWFRDGEREEIFVFYLQIQFTVNPNPFFRVWVWGFCSIYKSHKPMCVEVVGIISLLKVLFPKSFQIMPYKYSTWVIHYPSCRPVRSEWDVTHSSVCSGLALQCSSRLDFQTGQRSASLTLKSVQKEHEGLYTVRLHTWDGTVEHSAFVYVKGQILHNICLFMTLLQLSCKVRYS